MAALVINTIVGGGIFGVPGELAKLLGRASPIAMLLGAAVMSIFMACFAEVASQFSEPGGAYLYARSAFGRFISLQVGWMELLSVTVGLAALSTLFVDYFVTLLPRAASRWERALLVGILIAIPAIANWRGVRSGAKLNNVTTVAKLLPLLLLIALGAGRFILQPQSLHVSDVTSPGIGAWARAMVFVVFIFGGWEDTVVPSGEIDDARRTVPFGLFTALLTCAAIYSLLQFVTVATVGTESAAPLAHASSVLLGANGARFVTIAALVSIYGWASAAMLYGPRLAYSLAAQRDFPAVFARIHPRFHTPSMAILLYASAAWVLAATGTFVWLVALGAGTMLVLYASTCAALIRLRICHKEANAFRVRFGPALGVAGIAVCIALMTGLQSAEIWLMSIIAMIAAVNWLVVRHRGDSTSTTVATKRASTGPTS